MATKLCGCSALTCYTFCSCRCHRNPHAVALGRRPTPHIVGKNTCRVCGGQRNGIVPDGRCRKCVLLSNMAATMGRRGGQAKSPKKTASARVNGAKGGRPRKGN